MPPFSKLSRSKSIQDVSITSWSVLDCLTPAISHTRPCKQPTPHKNVGNKRRITSVPDVAIEETFFQALSQAASCNAHRCSHNRPIPVSHGGRYKSKVGNPYVFRTPGRGHGHTSQHNLSLIDAEGSGLKTIVNDELVKHQRSLQPRSKPALEKSVQSVSTHAHRKQVELHTSHKSWGLGSILRASTNCGRIDHTHQLCKGFGLCRNYHSRSPDLEAKQRRFAKASNLPSGFFDDVSSLTKLVLSYEKTQHRSKNKTIGSQNSYDTNQTKRASDHEVSEEKADNPTSPDLNEQMNLVRTLRELEERLQRTRRELEKSISRSNTNVQAQARPTAPVSDVQSSVLLTKEDYKNLVDLYYYSYNSRFSPESTDLSPNPLLLDDYSFTLSSDFSAGATRDRVVNEDESYESPLRKIAEQLKRRQLREIAVMQVFVDLLIDERSSNRALYEAYKELPEPGAAHLPLGVTRLFMQRMSTPWTLSEKSMLRYLSLVDDMQKANIAITPAEWSCAIYLAGRAFRTITNRDVNSAFNIWKAMEQEAGVKADHVTFNILFDIAVRSGKFALGETVLKEMHSRNLRLNRLGRVSLMYYHGLRKDGDGVRKAYRDFVESGEIVDTLVLNCVIASLFNAQEPQAAEQIYARMKDMQSRLVKGLDRYGEETLYKRYPGPGGCTIDQEMASNHLGRVLTAASRLRTWSAEHHQSLQAKMPLTPNHITFRSMISYHATVSGDLDRLTVLLQEMTELFHLPLQTITFHLLFKGFTIHGPKGGPHSNWSVKRLDACWKVCIEAIRESEDVKISLASAYSREGSSRNLSEEDDQPPTELILPSITQINAVQQGADVRKSDLPAAQPPPRKLSGWADFVLDLAGFSQERQQRLEHFHASMSDSENADERHQKRDAPTFKSPYFQSEQYTAPEPRLDKEEGEYVLPNPSQAAFLNTGREPASLDPTSPASRDQDGQADATGSPHQVAATRLLMCWVIRAYARNTKSRRKVEEVWGQIRKVYKPRDAAAYEGIIRVLRRCLRDCDREGGGGTAGSGGWSRE